MLPRDATVAVAGGKGGSGNTTATLGLARALATRGRRPLAVDADVDVPNLHIRAGIDREPGLPAVHAGSTPASVARESPDHPGVVVLPAGSDRRGIRQALDRAAGLDRTVLLDCPAAAGPDASDPLRVADATVIVATATPAGRTDAAKTGRMARSLDGRPVVWLERDVGGAGAADRPAIQRRLRTFAIPDGDRHPLRDDAVRSRFEHIATALYG